MSNVKKPNWDKITKPSVFGSQEHNKSMPPIEHIASGMTASAKLDDVTVNVRIQNVFAENNIEGQIINIHSTTETIKDLSVDDIVYITQGFYHLNQDIKT